LSGPKLECQIAFAVDTFSGPRSLKAFEEWRCSKGGASLASLKIKNPKFYTSNVPLTIRCVFHVWIHCHRDPTTHSRRS